MQLLLSASVQAGGSNLDVTTDDDGDDDNDYYDDRRHQVHHFEQMSSRCVVNSIKIKQTPVQTELNSIYYRELHVSTYLRPSSGSQLVFKT